MNLMGIDVGTTSVKGAVYTESGQCIFMRSYPYPTITGNSAGWVEQNPQDWLDSIERICNEAKEALGDKSIGALGLTSQVNTHVFVDSEGNPLLDAIVWQDQRCADAAAKLNAAISDELRAACWDPNFAPDPSFLMSRAQWLFDEHPDLWQKTRWILSPKDFCLMQLTGEVAADAITSIGLVDAQGAYLNQAFQLIDGLADKLPPIRPIEAIVGHVTQEGLLKDVPAVVGIMDAWASLYGSGVSAHGDAFQVAGTSEILGAVSDQNHGAKGVITFPPLPGWYLHAGPTQMGGDAAKWFAEFMGFDELEMVFKLAESTGETQNPLLFLPHLMGERAPLWDPNARGAFLGMNREHTKAEMAKAVLEGVGYAARLSLTAIEQSAGFTVAAMRLSGGGARSDLWSQIKADIMDRPIHKLANLDTGAFGAALIAGVGSGYYANMAEAGSQSVKVEKEFAPNPAKRSDYDALFSLYRESYQSLIQINQGFVQLTSGLKGAGKEE